MPGLATICVLFSHKANGEKAHKYRLCRHLPSYIGLGLKIVSRLLIITMYEVGFIINRLSSIIIAPILEKTKIWPKEKYNIDISKISESNSKFQSMITELVLMRSHILAYLILGMLSLISNYKWLSIICVFLIVTFIVAGRKHNTRINIIRKSFEKEENERKTREKDVHNFLAYNGTSQEDN